MAYNPEVARRHHQKYREARNERSRLYDHAHRQEVRIRKQVWGKDHPEKIKAYHRAYYLSHAEECKAKQRIRYQTYPEQARAYTQSLREAWLEIITRLGMDRCSKCGYNQCFAAIDFHHLDPTTKNRGIGRLLICTPTPERVAELSKTIPLCSNCHREIHDQIRKEKLS